MEALGKALLLLGVLLALAGAAMLLASRHVGMPWLGRLPGDIVAHRGVATVYIPVVTMLLVSLVLTILVNLIVRLLR